MNSGYNPQNDPFNQSTMTMRSVAQSPVEVRMNFIRKTYALFMAGILMCVVAGTATLMVPALGMASIAVLRNPIIAIALIFGGSIAAQAVSEKEGLNYVALFGFTGLMGFLFSPIVAYYAPAVVGQAAFLTILIFGSLTAYVFVTRKDFSFLGGFLFVGILTVVLASVANFLFFKSWDASYWIACAMLLMSSGFVLYKTSNIMHHYSERSYCSAALSLFISFINIFMSLLRILSGRR
jgi:modulator of FtsH protease